ncbi:MAG: YlxR family protein [Clostridia bacterium]|nr:YlxR family protein [Clostridia bacterium]MBQ2518062.1 YlxR family protein [Clostridia bacterium]
MRMCVGCRAMKEKRQLVRVVRAENGEAELDLTGKMNGRGAYVCPDPECLKRAVKSRALDRALEVKVSDAAMERLTAEIERRAAHDDC